MQQVRILCVCLGNICRSPLAEGLLRHHASLSGLQDRVLIDSAGTAGWHEGKPADSRSIAVARQHGLDISLQRSRPIIPKDFDHFDLILGMDADNVANLINMRPPDATAAIHLLSDYARTGRIDVADPYYGGSEDFLAVYQQLDQLANAIIQRLATEPFHRA